MTDKAEKPFFTDKFSFLNILFLLGNPAPQAIILIFSIGFMAYTDYRIDGDFSGINMYLGGPIGAGIARWFLKKKEGRPFGKCFFEWSSLCAVIMLLFQIMGDG